MKDYTQLLKNMTNVTILKIDLFYPCIIYKCAYNCIIKSKQEKNKMTTSNFFYGIVILTNLIIWFVWDIKAGNLKKTDCKQVTVSNILKANSKYTKKVVCQVAVMSDVIDNMLQDDMYKDLLIEFAANPKNKNK